MSSEDFDSDMDMDSGGDWDDEDGGSGSGSEGSGSGSDEEDDKPIELENLFYTATDFLEEGELNDALDSFQQCVKKEAEFLASEDVDKPKWSFKCLQQIVLLQLKMPKKDGVLDAYKALLGYKGDDGNTNLLSKAINSILDAVAAVDDDELSSAIFEITGEKAGGGGEKGAIYWKTNLKKAQSQLKAGKYDDLRKTLAELEAYVHEKGSKSDQLLDVYALEIQAAMDNNDKVAVKNVYTKARRIVDANPGTLTSKLPIFNYCGGKLQMEERRFDEAYGTLFDAFKYYVDIGSDLRVPTLKYMLMANMLKPQGQKINPFDSQEVSHMRHHASIEPIAQLLDAYERNNIRAFERILRENPEDIEGDAFFNMFVGELLTKVRIAVIKQLVKPYTRISVQFLATQLTVNPPDIVELLVRLILDNELEGRIDAVTQILELEGAGTSGPRYRALERWSTQIKSVTTAITGVVF